MAFSRIALVNACLPPRDVRQLAAPQGPLAIATILAHNGFETHLTNAALIEPDRFGVVALTRLLVSLPESVVALSVWDPTFPFVVEATRVAKLLRPELRFILGGPAASTVGDEAIAAFPWLDAVVLGEGESRIAPLLRFMSTVGGDPASLPTGVLVRTGGQIVTGRTLCPSLAGSAIPVLNYGLLDHAPYGRSELCTSRGCPYDCAFCSVNSAWGPGVRFRPVEHIRAELDALAQHTSGLSLLHVLDDTFLLRREHAHTMLDAIAEHPSRPRFTCYARVEDLVDERLQPLLSSGCVGVFVGLEAPKLKRGPVLDPDHAVARIVQAAQRLQVMTSLIWGVPGETLDDVEAMLKRVQRLADASPRIAINLCQLAPLSGTVYAREHRVPAFNPDDTSEFVYPEHLPPLRESPEVVALIRSYPQIFPAFFRVETPEFERKRRLIADSVAPWQPPPPRPVTAQEPAA